jgi:PAS domain S-box-containing protein
MKTTLKALFLVYFLCCNLAVAQLYTFKNYGHKDGLSIASVTSILQNDNGTIWLGTDGAGIIRYDGYDFNELPTNKTNKDHHVSSIFQKGNEIIFSSIYKGLYSFKNGKYSILVPFTDNSGAFQYAFGSGKNIYYITTKGVFKYEYGTSKKLYSLNYLQEEFRVHNIIPLRTGIVILTNKGNFFLSGSTERLTSLNNWLHISRQGASFVRFGYHSSDRLYLYDDRFSRKIEIILNEKDQIFKLERKDEASPLSEKEKITAFDGNEHGAAFLTTQNDIYKLTNNRFHLIAHNYLQPLEMCHGILVDRNSDIWLTSELKGLYKVSLEPFTRIQLHPVYGTSSICAINRASNGAVMISTMEDKTYFGQIGDQNSTFIQEDFRVNSACELGGSMVLGTNIGLKLYDLASGAITVPPNDELRSNKITFVFHDDGIFYIGIAEKGLKAYNATDWSPKAVVLSNQTYPYIYTAQISNDHKKIVFGTNNGLVTYDKKQNKFSKVPLPRSAGSYSGTSTRDVYGNSWFTCDHALIGILKSGEIAVLDDVEMFPSTLFYTLNSDNFGNLIVGTNKGINIINLTEYGEVTSYKWYTGSSGFEGYETHMRSQFRDGNSIFVGTVEGLFLINTVILKDLPAPGPPSIERITTNMNRNANSVQFRFLVENPKIKGIEYSYRIKGYLDAWTEFSETSDLELIDLPNGNYTLEVKATYDGKVFSSVGKYAFSVDIPFWKSKWFIFILLFLLVTANIILINKNKSLSTGQLFETRETTVTYKLTPTIILFGMLANTSLHLMAPYIDETVKDNLALTIASGLIMLSLYLLSLSAKNNHRTENYKFLLTSAFAVVILQNLINTYQSNLHPFYILAIIITNALTPFIFERIKWVLTYTILLVLTGCLFVLILDNTIYNEFLFLLALIVSVVIAIFGAYLRDDSLEKLIFISGVINKGDVPAIAFNSKGIMTYVSENIKNLIPVNNETLIGQPISSLNIFVPEEGSYRKVDLTKEFEDGKKYLVPMISVDHDIKWMEWSCKVFNEDLKVILGQNVTQRLELENTYELLVQNAEDLIYQCDVNGHFRFLNDKCYSKLGYNETELLGMDSLMLVTEDYHDNVSEFYKSHFENRKKSSYMEFPIRKKNGSVIWVGQYVTTLYKPGENKIVNGFLALARDITIMREQQEIIKAQRDDITSSINYAQKIQLNLLPSRSKFLRSFEEACVIYRPKDIVSGDFYWLDQHEHLTIVALADCTGHGVPGSFMTLLGINLLNNIVLEQRILDPGTILDELDKKLIAALPRTNGDESMNDGMEITICVIDHRTAELSYACAGSRFLIYENNSFTMYKGDTKHIGDAALPGFKGFITHFTKLSENSTLYLFTDGFQDQFGGSKDKKYSFRRMLELFEANIRLPLSEQEGMIAQEFDQWRADEEQTDDVSILALRGLSDSST